MYIMYKDNNIMKTQELTALTKNNINNNIHPCVIFCPIPHPPARNYYSPKSCV